MEKTSIEPEDISVDPKLTEEIIDKHDDTSPFTSEQKERLVISNKLSRQKLTQRTFIAWILFVSMVVLYICFIVLTFYVAINYNLTAYSVIPVCLMGILPTAVAISVLRGLYPRWRDKEPDPKLTSLGAVDDFAKKMLEDQ